MVVLRWRKQWLKKLKSVVGLATLGHVGNKEYRGRNLLPHINVDSLGYVALKV